MRAAKRRFEARNWAVEHGTYPRLPDGQLWEDVYERINAAKPRSQRW